MKKSHAEVSNCSTHSVSTIKSGITSFIQNGRHIKRCQFLSPVLPLNLSVYVYVQQNKHLCLYPSIFRNDLRLLKSVIAILLWRSHQHLKRYPCLATHFYKDISFLRCTATRTNVVHFDKVYPSVCQRLPAAAVRHRQKGAYMSFDHITILFLQLSHRMA